MPIVGDSITAVQYNNTRTSLVSVYSTLYGQTMRSSAVTASVDSVTSQQMLDLFLDAQSAYVHQQATISSSIAVPPTGQTVGADTSQTFNQSTGAKAIPTDGTKQGANDYTTLITNISNFNPSTTAFPIGNFTLGTATSSARSTTWGGSADTAKSIYHVVTITFSSAAQMGFFFNAGGELRFSSTLTSGTGSKSTDWASLLSAMGTIRFGKYALIASSGTPTSAGSGGSGYDSLTSTYRQLFIKTGSGLYADNDYIIEGRTVSSTVLRFRISFNDDNTGLTVDESVDGTITSNVNTFRPDSSFVYNAVTYTAVSIAAPAIATVVAMTTDNVTPPA
jgi:hypothetical protein